MSSVRTAAAAAAEIAAALREQYLISTEGFLYHSVMSLTTRLTDITYPNPYFEAPKTTDPILNEGIGIYCIHGTADTVVAFNDVAKNLINDLPSAISSIHLVAFEDRGKGISIKDYAEQLLKKIQANGHKTVILAGHSRGGLVAAYLYEFLAKEAGINVLFSFSAGTPFGGSLLALPPLTWFSKSVQEMQKGSELLQELHAKKDKSHTYVCAAAAGDSIVKKEDATFNDEPAELFPHHGHLSMMHDPKLLRFFLRSIYENVYKLIPYLNSKTSEELKAEEDDYCDLKEIATPQLWDIYFEITLYLEDLRRSPHLQNATDKINVFEKLQRMIYEMMKENHMGDFDQTKEFGEFLHAFLADDMKSDKSPGSVIDKQLNFPLSLLFGNAKTNSRLFVERLDNTYKNIALPRPQAMAREEHESISTTSTLRVRVSRADGE
jgi:pimeloyl-ACP methyl ester carboxylesterase